ncbi:coiled-coil domain-containing protein 180 [Oncorhynchus mykiss]|uniref:Coiled-coil domain containing 180 n=1 Tax=Oncorhynchus mykiss TaxID=8022 RepID=A0A8K9WN71_ONCMY|nr:coiled-coil domain-containing protein 180 [Oncorhynchus mykiss]
MAETRVIPSGKVYRQMFDAQVQLSRSLHDTRRKRETNEGFLPRDNPPLSRDTDTGLQQRIRTIQAETHQCSEEMAVRDQLFSGIKHCQTSEEQLVEEEIRGLPDHVVAEKPGSDIIDRLMEKKQRNHLEAVAQLYRDLSVLSVEYETLFRQTGQEVLHQLSVYDGNVERQMQRIENISDLEKFTLQGLHEFWDTVKQESVIRRKWIKDLDDTLAKYESDRTAMIAALLRKYTGKLEKICYVMPSDIHRLINREGMMINQAILANRRAVAKLHLNLMENDLQKEVFHRLRWEDKLQDWKSFKVLGVVSRFKDFMGSPPIQGPKDVQAILDTMSAAQQSFREKRITILQSLIAMIPPRCSKTLIAEWYNSLSSVNEQIDCMHIESMRKLHSYYENTWQECLAEVEQVKKEITTYGVSPEEIQDTVNVEFLPLIGKCQSQTEEHLATMDRAFESLAKRAAVLSKSLFKFTRGASHLWEVHSAGLQRREQQLQDQLDEVRYSQEHEIQKKEANLDVMLDRLRQESTEEALKIALEKALHSLDEIKLVYMHFYKEEVDTVESYPAMVLEELHSYSFAVSRFFNVKEIYTGSQDSEELRSLYPVINLDLSGRASVKRTRQTTVQGRKRCPGGFQKSPNPAHSSFDEFDTEDVIDSHREFLDSQSSETFCTCKGNVYNGQSFVSQWDTEQDSIPSEMELVVFPRSLLADLQKDIRLLFFNHLEERYQTALTNTMNIVAAKKEALKSEQDLRLHLHQPRAKRIEVDIHNVRAAELVLHRDRVDRHCKGILQALGNCRTDFHELQIRQHKLTEDFRSQIYSMEDVFTYATKSDVLVGLCGTLQSNLESHMNIIQASQRNFRQTLESKLDGLRETNVQLIKSFKLFSDGGNFTPKEIEAHHKRIEKMVKRIDSNDEAIMLDMEGTESKCLELAKDVINRFEEKFHFLTVDLKFLEKIQGMLTNTQVQIKTEATKSNMQNKKINSLLTELKSLVDTCARSSPEKTVTTDDVFTFTWSIIEELRARCHYLQCFLNPSMAVLMPECPLQGAFAVAARPKSRKSASPAIDGLLQPSRMGVSFMDDVAVGVIRGLLRLSKPKVTQEANSESTERVSAAVTVRLSSPIGQRSGDSAESVSAQSVKRFSKPTRFDKRFQVFGPKPETHGVTTFKSLITSILWKTNDILLLVAEEFYKKKERRPITRPQYLQETFEQCAEEINKRLLVYQSQTQDYHNNCLQEFRQQLKDIEEGLSKVPGVLISKLGEQHLRSLSQDTDNIRQQLGITLHESEGRKKKHSGKLGVRLSHPACEKELEALNRAEEERQRELTNAIKNTLQELQACVRKHGEEFVRALTSLTENLLFQMDNLLTVDEVQVGQAEMKSENVTTLIRRKQAGIPLEEKQSAYLIQRGSRTWPGISNFGSSTDGPVEQPCKKTASITTAKTTLGHLRAVEARESMYQFYEQRHREELARAVQESQVQRTEVQCWEEHWRGLLNTLTQLNAE